MLHGQAQHPLTRLNVSPDGSPVSFRGRVERDSDLITDYIRRFDDIGEDPERASMPYSLYMLLHFQQRNQVLLQERPQIATADKISYSKTPGKHGVHMCYEKCVYNNRIHSERLHRPSAERSTPLTNSD